MFCECGNRLIACGFCHAEVCLGDKKTFECGKTEKIEYWDKGCLACRDLPLPNGMSYAAFPNWEGRPVYWEQLRLEI